jgi:hypothetical protein
MRQRSTNQQEKPGWDFIMRFGYARNHRKTLRNQAQNASRSRPRIDERECRGNTAKGGHEERRHSRYDCQLPRRHAGSKSAYGSLVWLSFRLVRVAGAAPPLHQRDVRYFWPARPSVGASAVRCAFLPSPHRECIGSVPGQAQLVRVTWHTPHVGSRHRGEHVGDVSRTIRLSPRLRRWFSHGAQVIAAYFGTAQRGGSSPW